MFTCPHCDTALSERKDPSLGLVWICPSCHGRAMTLNLLRKTAPKSLVDHLWQKARTDGGQAGRPCPACPHRMAKVAIIPGDGGTIYLEVCTHCYFIWFDPHKFEALPRLKQEHCDFDGLSDEAKKALALARLAVLQQEELISGTTIIKSRRWRIALEVISILLDVLLG